MNKRETIKCLHPLDKIIIEKPASCYSCQMLNRDQMYKFTCFVLNKAVACNYWCEDFEWNSDDIKRHEAYLAESFGKLDV